MPLGFLIYQIYYHSYDIWMPLSLAPQDRGGDILRSLPEIVRTELTTYEPAINIADICEPSKIPLLHLVFGPDLRRLQKEFRNRKGKEKYRRQRQANFEVIRFYLTLISTRIPSELFKSEYTSLSDIYNAIGASRMALILSFVLYVMYNLFSPVHRLALVANALYPALINLLVFVWMLAMIQSRRTRTGAACQAMLANTAQWHAAQKKINES